MSLTSDYLEARKKLKKKNKNSAESESATKTADAPVKSSLTEDYLKARKKLTPVVDDDDIAPVLVNSENEDNRKWYEKVDDALKSSWMQKASDALDAATATNRDFELNVLQGVGNLAEGVTDFILYGASKAADVVGADKVSEGLNKAAQHTTVDKIADAYRGFVIEDKSKLGDGAVNFAQGLGNAMGIVLTGGAGQAAGLSAKGVSALTTGATFMSSAGGSMSEAYADDATDEEATKYGLMQGTIDAASELLFGGLGKAVNALGISRGIGALDDIFAKKLTGKIGNIVARNIVQGTIKATGEGLEEVVAGLGSAVAKKLTYKSDEELEQLVKDENLLESFIQGTLIGGVMSGADVAQSIQNKTDYVTGLTDNEQKVVDKVVENRIAEEEASGKKLTNKDKSKIYDEVLNELDRGGISIDTIEEALGGETYKTYKDTVDSEDSLLKEYEELGNKTNATLAEQSRYAELTQQVKDLKANSQRDQLKSKLGEEVFTLAKDSRLVESYNEKARRSQVFEADISKYDAKPQTVIQKAIDSGILNNTRRTHEFVDMIAKISADKNVPFDFTNNARLKESGFAVDGKSVNGFVTKDGITLNMDSHKAWQSTVGHEITHVLEGTELYTELQTVLFEYAKSKNDYQGRYDSLTELYKDIEGANVDAELTADLVGDYLFTDENFISNLSTNHRNVFRKIYDEIKYLYKVATAGSKEARELEKVKRAFDKAYRTQKNTADNGGTKYSISETTDGRYVAVVDNDILKNIDISTWDKTKKNAAKKAASEALKQFSEGIVVDGITRKVNKVSRREYTRSNYTESLYNQTPEVFADKMRAADVADDIVVAATNWRRDGGVTHPRTDNFVDFDHGSTLIASGDTKYSAEVVVGITDTGDAVFYDVVDMTPATFDIKTKESPTTATTQNAIGDIQGDSSTDSIPQSTVDVNTKFSLSAETDKNYLDAVSRGDTEAPRRYGNFATPARDLRYEAPVQEDVAPVRETAQEDIAPVRNMGMPGKFTEVTPVEHASGVEAEALAPVRTATPAVEEAEPSITTTKEKLTEKLHNLETELANNQRLLDGVRTNYEHKIAELRAEYDAKKNKDSKTANNILRRIERLQRLSGDVSADYLKRISDLEAKIAKTNERIPQDHTKEDRLERKYKRIDDRLAREKAALTEEFKLKKKEMQAQLGNMNTYVSDQAMKLYQEIRDLRKGVRASKQLAYLLDHGDDWNSIKTALLNVKRRPDRTVDPNSEAESVVREMLKEDYDSRVYELKDIYNEYQRRIEELEVSAEAERAEARKEEQILRRTELHKGIVESAKSGFTEKGFDLDIVLEEAKDLSAFATVDNTPQRVMEKALGYKEGQIFADITVNKAAQNETEGIKWLNYFTDRKNGLLAKISEQYNIKPGSKESAAAQIYAEGFYVDEHGHLIEYGDAELTSDFPDTKTTENIRGLAGDPRIRQIYDDSLAMINESRTRNAYPEIPRRENYFLHFRAMEDTFSKLGLPFNPNDIKAKDLPTDLNGVTADLKPGQPFFASAMRRTGRRTSYDLLGGLERYLSCAKNQIYHIDDIQTLRALRNYIADTYGQAKGLENLDALTEEEAQQRIEDVYGAHLSTFAKFLNEEANILAGKTSLVDRGLEGIIGRRGITFLDTVNKQVGSNMVGFNVSSSLTNFLPVVQTFAKTNKFDFVKAFAQTVTNKVGSVFGRSDGFAENSSVVIRRKGADRFYRTPWQKVADPGYALMSAVDDISTELIARTKYNEFTRKGMDSRQAHLETDKWVSRLMGDRSLGQQPQLYNSKMLGLLTKFQLEVRNQLDSQFYDTIKEAKASNEGVQNGLLRNAKTAAKVTSTFFQLAVVQHLFGKAFESVAGYNPAFDIIDVLIKTFGWDDGEESEDTVLDNIEEGILALIDDLPYTSTFTGGRIPVSSALPIEQFVTGKDQYGNDKSRWETLGEVVPYYVLPGGYGQIKKTVQGLNMFSDDHPTAGSYTDSGNLRFPVDDTVGNKIQAGIFGQWASENARDYFNDERIPLKEKQIREYKALDVSIQDYWEYQDAASEISKRAESEDATDEDVLKSKYLNSVNDELSKLLAEEREVADDPELTAKEKQERVTEIQERFDALSRESYETYGDVSFDGDYANIGDRYFQWYTPEEGEPYWRKLTDEQATKYKVTSAAGGAHYATDGTVHYRLDEGGDWRDIGDWTKISDNQLARQKEVTSALGITPEEYWSKTEISFIPMTDGEYEYAYDSPEDYAIAKAVGGYDAYKTYSKDLYDIKADKDENGKSISGSRKEKVLDYINDMDADYGEKIILFKSEYNADDTYNYEIIDYLNSRDDISYEEMETILKELGFTVDSNGNITW